MRKRARPWTTSLFGVAAIVVGLLWFALLFVRFREGANTRAATAAPASAS